MPTKLLVVLLSMFPFWPPTSSLRSLPRSNCSLQLNRWLLVPRGWNIWPLCLTLLTNSLVVGVKMLPVIHNDDPRYAKPTYYHLPHINLLMLAAVIVVMGPTSNLFVKYRDVNKI